MILLFMALFGVGIYLLLQKSMAQIIIGLIAIGNAINLSIFLGSGPEPNNPPFIEGLRLTLGESNDPVPQALVLTAIVISFALVSFTVSMGRQLKRHGIENIEMMEEE